MFDWSGFDAVLERAWSVLDERRRSETMTGRWLYTQSQPPHHCEWPDDTIGHYVGDIWQCGECEKCWRLTQLGDRLNGNSVVWHEVEPPRDAAERMGLWKAAPGAYDQR